MNFKNFSFKIACLAVLMTGNSVQAMDITKDLNKQLINAASDGNIQQVETCIANGAYIDVKGRNNHTPLMRGALYGYNEICELLIAKGANLNAQDVHGYTPLIWAAINGHREICKLLLENGADMNVRDMDGWNALIGAAKNGHNETCKLLIENEIEINLNHCGTISGKIIIKELVRPSQKDIDSLIGLIAGLKTVKTTLLNQDMKKLMPQMIFADIKLRNKARAHKEIMKIENEALKAELLQYLDTL